MCWLKHTHVCCHDLHVLVAAGFVLHILSRQWRRRCWILGGILTVPVGAEQLDCRAWLIRDSSAAPSRLTGG